MNALSTIAQSADRSHRSALRDRVRFEAPNGKWASLGFPTTSQPLYRVWTHARAGNQHQMPQCSKFEQMADALDFIALWVKGNSAY